MAKRDKKDVDPAEGAHRAEVKRLIEQEREELILDIMKAMSVESWGNHPLTRAYATQLEERAEAEAVEMQHRLVADEKPVSSAEQLAFRGRRSALLSVKDELERQARASLIAIEKARQYEQTQEQEQGMYYEPPTFSYEEEARNRLGTDEGQAVVKAAIGAGQADKGDTSQAA